MPLISAVDKMVFTESVIASGKHIHAVDKMVFKEGYGIPYHAIDYMVFQESVNIRRSTQLGTIIDKMVFKESVNLTRGTQLGTIIDKMVFTELVNSAGHSVYDATYYISAETPIGVIPQTGSATYPKWEHTRIKEVEIDRKMVPGVLDPEESGRERLTGLRNMWSLSQDLNGTQADTFWTFITSHVGSGKPFYFYDLQNNNFVYDPTGVETSGRYLVRFVPDSFTREQYVGSRQYGRFLFNYDVIEVEG